MRRRAGSARIHEVGALDAWHGEILRGVDGQRADAPATWKLDQLWRAACREAAGREFDRLGLPSIGDRCRREAAEILARRGERGAAA